MSKLTMYQALVECRKTCTKCSDLENPSKIHRGRFDSDEIGPYANWQGNLDAPLLVIGQDFADRKSFSTTLKGWPGTDVETNRTLIELAAEAGYSLKPPMRGVSDDVLFFTNAVLCMKKGSMGSHVPNSCFAHCAKAFLRETVELVAPRAVVTLGTRSLSSVAIAFDRPPPTEPLRALVEKQPAFLLHETIAVFPRYHPSPRTRAARPLALQREDWRRIRDWLHTNAPT